MKSFFEITRKEYSIFCNPVHNQLNYSVLIPTHGNDRIQYLYLVNLFQNTVIRWTINLSQWIEYVKATFEKEGFIIDNTNLIYGKFIIHNAIFHNNNLYLFPISGNFILVLDINTSEYDIIFNGIYNVFCSTCNISGNKLYLTQWEFKESLARGKASDDVTLHFGYYDLTSREFSKLKNVNGPDSIHQTHYCQEHNTIIAVEMQQFLNVPYNPGNKDKRYLKNVVDAGICDARVLLYDLNTDRINTFYMSQGPAHIYQKDPNEIFIVSCNLSIAYCLGTGKIDKYRLNSGCLRLAGSYQSDDLYRVPTLDHFSYEGKNYLCTAVFPNQVHIIDLDSMCIYQKNILSYSDITPSFEDGPFIYPSFDRTPYTVFAFNDSPYLILSSLWSLSVLDFRTGRIVSNTKYNIDRSPLITTGHSIIIENQNIQGSGTTI